MLYVRHVNSQAAVRHSRSCTLLRGGEWEGANCLYEISFGCLQDQVDLFLIVWTWREHFRFMFFDTPRSILPHRLCAQLYSRLNTALISFAGFNLVALLGGLCALGMGAICQLGH